MPSIYLAPSSQDFNSYIIGGNEEYFMNLLADAMEPYLIAGGIDFSRNSPDMTARQSVEQANAGRYDFYVSLHSNASPPGYEGVLRGPNIYYYTDSTNGRRMAQIMANNLTELYPIPELVTTVPSSSLVELRGTKAPAVLVEIAYHDNADDARFIVDNLDAIAETLVVSIADYFGIPFVEPPAPRRGTVVTRGGELNVRSAPLPDARITGSLANSTRVLVLEALPGWYFIFADGVSGFASSDYITISE